MRCFADVGTRAEVAIRFVGTPAACGTRQPPEGDVLVPWLAASAVALALLHEDLSAHSENEAHVGLAAFHAVALAGAAGAIALRSEDCPVESEHDADKGLVAVHAIVLPEVAGAVAIGHKERVK